MNIEFNGVSCFRLDKYGQYTHLGDCFSNDMEYLPEIDESAKQALLGTNKDSSFSCTLNACDLELLEKTCKFDHPEKFTIEFDEHIMIQARWHKKVKVRKKWLKRYGMKPDTVHVKTDAACLSEHDGCLEFETKSLQYIWKPHQERRNIKIEWKYVNCE